MTTLGMALLLAVAGPALAQGRVEERRPASADALIDIENAAGSIKVTGWDREELLVTGTLGRRAGGLEIHGTERRLHVEVNVEGNPNSVVSDLEVRVPNRARLSLETYSAKIVVADVQGRLKAESVSGDISVSGAPPEVEIETVSGKIEVLGPVKRLKAEGTNGSVTVKGATGTVNASTVNGRLEVAGDSFDEVRLEAVNGELHFDGSLAATGTLDVETVNGPIELALPAAIAADFTISSFGGQIDSDFELTLKPRTTGRAAREHGDREHRQREMYFTANGGGAKVSITTLNGGITLRKR